TLKEKSKDYSATKANLRWKLRKSRKCWWLGKRRVGWRTSRTGDDDYREPVTEPVAQLRLHKPTQSQGEHANSTQEAATF
ncbi:hypothetical protein, partial [Paraclostridium dentum]|uniref:hypothetical protein n=1 Tax=Paraclostridium dentum TaxID=2662455 RepID=UPI003F40E944